MSEQVQADAVQALAIRMLEMLNGGALALMISIGHRTGLFDAMAELDWASSAGIAEAAGLDERYVREWLGAMTAGAIVEIDPARGNTYRLPPEHAACLTRGAAPDNLAAFAQYIAVLGSVEDRIVECFETGGGIPYSAFPRFQEVMAEDSGQSVLPALISDILPLEPELPERLRAGIDVLDVGCGSGRALNLLAREYPASRFVGYDLSEEAIARGRAEAGALRLDNVRFEVRDVSKIEAQDAFDLVTAFDAIHDQVAPDVVLEEIASALRVDGLFLMQDIAASTHHHRNLEHPIGPFLYTISCMHCMTVSLAGGGAGLGAMWGEERALQLLSEAGFQEVRIEKLPHDIQNQYYLARLRG